ncbi:MucBP domain-containing protein [Listeria seeligeri]|uniref:MucBP domain-containing protein n=1 Tax=Listeria seeligeri TaxID=1640 RepID=UPI0016251FEB|nr:MucBP domain-containing protein [Listeria seeligeri]MBC1534387.1 MucBP domain-containing protein [Listeria seeligeri]MBC1741317.1 MucBP domain-containing protein [Listeria seeligeri]MBC1746969.1 MucBP domain-containing protein [Listeria seeligeri]MBC1749645.1 MucBP domain-containing protein [Listeria seeligeri]MBC1822590.1 MucBP domain-containing protein [Listeria seeligeri]
MKVNKIGALLLGTALIVQVPFQVSAATNANIVKTNQTETAAPSAYISNKTLAATSDLELTVGEATTKSLHIQDKALPNNEWGSYISEVKVALNNLEGISYSIEYGPMNEEGTLYQYADVTLSGTPTKAGSGSFTIDYADGATNSGTHTYTVNIKSTTTVQYVDENGMKIAEDTTQQGDLNTAYTTEAKTIDGYTLDETKLPSNQNGQFGETNQTVTYIYTKDQAEVQAGADVTVKYVDADGNELAPEATLSGNVDADYTSEAKTIEGWTLKETPANATGTFSDEAQTVTYVYEKNADNSVTPTPLEPADNNENNANMKDDSTNLHVGAKTTEMKSKEKDPAKTVTTKNSLPKTGDNALENNLLVGLGALLLAGLFVFMRKTRKVK